ncbi:CheR family methyltransferase [Pseudoduganella ginsengisoli]|uniref:protein-glutamate O-methyltransferase n=1 Tax=Pseudoduganella ginsengisoli TaxID=1462440 RepID=A0A6L6Q0H2_9BURK|nr:protein-glutamate O-methyltransferase CheR [Pseudoduganella ginsengisoli]MTW03383.1 protein-glutamate O-methyltransferase CheR [Pseudoduganella ginsengisoli]
MAAAPELDRPTLAALIALVRKHTGITMGEHKRNLLERRLRPRMDALALSGYRAYLDRVEQDSDEVPHFIDLVTTNDTLFFRTPQIWAYLEQEFLPQWWSEHRGKRLDIWSAAAASGEELYSLAMLCEEFHAKHPAFRYRIVGTDISRQMLDLARSGCYSGRSVQRLREAYPARLANYFQPSPQGCMQVNDTLRKNIELRCHNLLHPLQPQQQFDLVLLRNVLIYFDLAHQHTVLEQARRSMAHHAVMIIGESESISRLDTAYTLARPMIYQMKAVAS